jgi:hypothetical protein
VLLLGTFVALSISDREKVGHEGNPFAPAHPAFWIVPALMVFNGMNPYLGLKTETSFAMFSNLRTEGGRSNHFLVPASVQLFDFQHDLVEVTDSSDRFLRYVARDRGLIPYFELRARLSRAPMASVSYIRNGEKVSVERAADDPELARAIPYLARKLLHFRVVNGTGREGCRH